MNLGEFKARVRDLGFADDVDLTAEDTAKLLVSSLNDALAAINKDVEGLYGYYEFTQDGTESGYGRIDLVTETMEGNTIVFDRPDGRATIETDGSIEAFNNYDIDEDRFLVMDSGIVGSFRFPYKKRVPYVTSEWEDTEELPIDYKVEDLLPFLAAYYMWLDDDMEIATRWYNEYDARKTAYLEEKEKKKTQNPRAKIRTDMNWYGV